ncbi:MAG: hypothetical protein IPH13_19900 [Planctomycetes bacterium]|nr:hypothetical protein [Planctomycetota bacterium]MCC7169017.1 hypothetical protein [Planctomycetota bacterium]
MLIALAGLVIAATVAVIRGRAADIRLVQGGFWIFNRSGSTAGDPRADGVLQLEPGDALRMQRCDESHDKLSLLRVRVRPRDGSDLIIALREQQGTRYELCIPFRANALATLSIARGGEPAKQLAQATRPLGASDAVELNVTLDGPTIAVADGSGELLTARDGTLAYGMVALSTLHRPLGLDEIELRVRSSDGRTRNPNDTFDRASSDENWLARALLLPLLLLAAAVGLRAFCFARPRTGDLVRGALVWLSVPAAWTLVAVALNWPWGVPGFAITAFVGLVFALVALRAFLAPTVHSARFMLVALAMSSLLGTSALFAADYRNKSLSFAAIEESIVPKTRVDPPASVPERDLGVTSTGFSAVVAWRDIDVALGVAIEPDSALEVRVRTNDRADGVAFVLSTSTILDGGLYLQAPDRHCLLDRAEAARPGTHRLLVRVRGRSFEAILDGGLVARADVQAYPAGGVAIAVVRGRARITDGEVRPQPPSPVVAPWLMDAARAALAALLAAAVAGLIAAWAVRGPWSNGLLVGAFALWPIAILAFMRGPDDGITTGEVAACVGVAFLWLAAFVQVHARGASFVRFAAFALALPCALFPAFRSATRLPTVPPASPGPSDLGPMTLHQTALWYQHPELRKRNGFLARHELRGRTFASPKPPGVRRVVCLGGSSTYGFSFDDAAKKDYPAQLDPLLNGNGPPIEVINAAWEGATGPFLVRFLRDVLVDLQPDVVTLSLFYNDSFLDMQSDAARRLEQLHGRSGLGLGLVSMLGEIELGAGRRDMARFLEVWKERSKDGRALELWQSTGLPSGNDAPPTRFERTLREFAQLANERGFRLVLVKEPLAGDKPAPFKIEYREAMDRVAAQHGLVVADPTPMLQAAGGAKLFVDEIHPTAAGYGVIAKMLAPILKEELDREK